MPDPDTVINGTYTRPIYTVATLPAAASMQGKGVYVSDAAANAYSNYALNVTGGGSVRCRVQSDGVSWKYAP